MNEVEEYILEQIRYSIWSGFCSEDDVRQTIDDLLEEDVDEAMLHEAARTQFAAKLEVEKTWPAVTDVDRLDHAFATMKSTGIAALHYAGMTRSDGIEMGLDYIRAHPNQNYRGFCYYHGQDLDRAIDDAGLYLGFGCESDEAVETLEVGKAVVSILRSFGFSTVWSESPEDRILIPKIDWKLRLSKGLRCGS